MRNLLFTKLVSVFLLATSLFANSETAPVDHRFFLSEDDIEVVYFFSYHCPGCYAFKDYVGLWEKVSNKHIIRFPVFSEEQWSPGALWFFLSNIAKEEHGLSQSELDAFSFTFLSNESSVSFVSMLDYMKKASRKDNIELFQDYYLDALNMKSDALLLLNEIGELDNRLISTPSFRVASSSGVHWLELDMTASNPGVDLIVRLNKVIKNESHKL